MTLSSSSFDTSPAVAVIFAFPTFFVVRIPILLTSTTFGLFEEKSIGWSFLKRFASS